MTNEETWNGVTRTAFRGAVARNLDGFQETIRQTNTMIGEELQTQSRLLVRLKANKKHVQTFNTVFDVLGFAGGLAGIGKGAAKAFFKHVAKTTAEKIGMNFAYELSRPNFEAEQNAQKAHSSQVASAHIHAKLPLATYGFVDKPLDAKLLGKALQGGPFQFQAIALQMSQKGPMINELSKEMARGAWDQMHHGSSLVVPKAGTDFERMVALCRSIIFQSLFMELAEKNLVKYKSLLDVLVRANYKDGTSIYTDLQTNGLLKVSPHSSVTDLQRQATLWAKSIETSQNMNPFEGLIK